MKIIFFDVETTGLDPKVHGMHQLAGEIVIDGVVVKKFAYKINPFDGYETNLKALAVSNTSSLDLLTYPKEYQIRFQFDVLLYPYKDWKNKDDKFYLAGWRAPEFDVKFLEAFFERTTPKGTFDTLFWNTPIDVKTLATQYLLEQRPSMKSFSLAPVAKHLGIEVDETKLHGAAYDAYLSRAVYDILPKCTLETTKKAVKKVIKKQK